MLRSSNCVLTGKTPAEFAKLNECPLDPGMCQFFGFTPILFGGYFFSFQFSTTVVLIFFLKHSYQPFCFIVKFDKT